MPKAHKFDGMPWWDDEDSPMHDADGNRLSYRIDYERIPLHRELWSGYGLYGAWSGDLAVRLRARKKLWRRLRTGFYERNEPRAPSVPGNVKQRVPRCGAKCRDGHACRARAVKNPVTGKRTRCRMHGGKSPGPNTQDGRARSLEALARGRETRRRNCCAKRRSNVSRLSTVPN